MATGVAVGVAPHTGWAWVVRVSGPRGAPAVLARARVVACGVLDAQLYHLASERSGDRGGFLEARRAAALAQAAGALRPLLGEAGAAVVLGKRLALPPLERIVAAHPLVHGAEGELWRAIFAEACAAGGLRVTRSVAGDVRAALEKRHGRSAVAAFLDEGRRSVGSPWSREPQEAALAAWSAL